VFSLRKWFGTVFRTFRTLLELCPNFAFLVRVASQTLSPARLTSDAGAIATALTANPQAICIESQACTDGDLSPDDSGLTVDAITVDEILAQAGIAPPELKQTFATKEASDV
jgi:hypothetical protein